MDQKKVEAGFPHGSIRAAVAAAGDQWRAAELVVITPPENIGTCDDARDAGMMLLAGRVRCAEVRPAQFVAWCEYIERGRRGEAHYEWQGEKTL
jgi:hypothetical protein